MIKYFTYLAHYSTFPIIYIFQYGDIILNSSFLFSFLSYLWPGVLIYRLNVNTRNKWLNLKNTLCTLLLGVGISCKARLYRRYNLKIDCCWCVHRDKWGVSLAWWQVNNLAKRIPSGTSGNRTLCMVPRYIYGTWRRKELWGAKKWLGSVLCSLVHK